MISVIPSIPARIAKSTGSLDIGGTMGEPADLMAVSVRRGWLRNPLEGVGAMSVEQQSVEQVLVVPTSLFHEVGHFQGFQADSAPYLKTLLDPANTSYRPRNEVEEDPGFKQLIPYCLFRCDGKVFYYRRGKGIGEGRLLSKRSLGIGGHISTIDEGGASSVYLEGMRREIEEEVHLDSKYTERLVGLINDDETEVGKVHLGIVHIFDLEAPKVLPREQSIVETGFAQPAELIGDFDSFETWSQICLKFLLEA